MKHDAPQPMRRLRSLRPYRRLAVITTRTFVGIMALAALGAVALLMFSIAHVPAIDLASSNNTPPGRPARATTPGTSSSAAPSMVARPADADEAISALESPEIPLASRPFAADSPHNGFDQTRIALDDARTAVNESRVEPEEPRNGVLGGTTRPASQRSGLNRSTSQPSGLDRSADARRERVKRFGGNADTEDAVDAGLAWLAAHQAADGTWSRTEFGRSCPKNDRCTGDANDRLDNSLDGGLTGLALLAFLGAGNTHATGEYTKTVESAVAALIRLQAESGNFGPDDGMSGYNNALATLALAEHLALTRDPRAERPVRRGVARLAASQQEFGGWDYYTSPQSGRSDTSITAWVVQALHAAHAAGVDPPAETLVKAAMHFARAAQADGRVWYADAGIGFGLDAGQQPMYRYGPAMTACGLVSQTLLGWRLDSPIMLAERGQIFAHAPSSALARGRDPTQLHGEYFWYYGTVAMFQVGGESWERWNARLRDNILPLQVRDKARDGRRKHAFGSWAPYGENWGKWGRMGGRVYTTAICTLTLEIYYRYTPAYLQADVLLTPDAWRDGVSTADSRRKLKLIPTLRDARFQVGEPVLVDLLRDADGSVGIAAATALAAIESPAGRELMQDAVTRLPPWERGAVEKALGQLARADAVARPAGAIRLFDRESGLATLNLERSYVGQGLRIEHDGTSIARMTVIQRFTGRPLAIARLEGAAGAEPREGDVARPE